MQVERSYYTIIPPILEKCSSSIRSHYDNNGKFEPPPTHPRQVNFLNDESGEMGKGDVVISRVHQSLETNSLGEKHIFFHADNCTEQNKNNP